MRASDLLGRQVRDADGVGVGVVHDLRVRLPADRAYDDPEAGEGHLAGGPAAPVVVALVVGPNDIRCRLAHAWGHAQGRSRGPALFRALLAGPGARARVIPVGEVDSWDRDGLVRLRGAGR